MDVCKKLEATAMSEKNTKLDVLTRVRNEMEASVIVQCLADCGIAASSVGGFTSGFKAEAPGDVAVLVKHDELELAKNELATFREGFTFDPSIHFGNAEEEDTQYDEADYELTWNKLGRAFAVAYILCTLITFLAFLFTRSSAYLVSTITEVLVFVIALLAAIKFQKK
jgi:hypothetical protein